MSARPPATMRAVRFHGPGRLAVERLPVPSLETGDVLVEVAACGICATDVKTYLRGHPKITAGAVLGHEIAGVVADGDGSLPTGARVAVAPYAPCGACRPCRRGQPTLCARLFTRTAEPGGFTEYVRVPSELVGQLVVPLPDTLPLVVATLAEPLACSLHVLRRCGVGPGDAVLIIGDGPMGLLQAETARALGAGPVVVAGMTPHRLAHAARVADAVIDVAAAPLEPAARHHLPDGADAVVVSVADVTAVSTAMTLARCGGVVDMFAGTPAGSRLDVDARRVHYDGVRLQGTFGFEPEHFRQAVRWLAGGQVAGVDLVTGQVDMEGVAAALDQASRHRGIKTVMTRPTTHPGDD